MALYLETTKEDGSVIFTRLENGQTNINANAGEKFRVVDGAGAEQPVNATQSGENLIVTSKMAQVEICGFYGNDKDGKQCELIGSDGSVATPDAQTQMVAANTATPTKDDAAAAAKTTTEDGKKVAMASDDDGAAGWGYGGWETAAILLGGVAAVGIAAAVLDDDDDAAVSNDGAGGGNGDGDGGDNAGGGNTGGGTGGGDNGGGTGGGDNGGGTGGGDNGGGTGGGDNGGGTGGGDNGGGTGGGDNGGGTGGGDNGGGDGGDNGGDTVPAAPTVNLEGGDNELGAEEAADGAITVSGTAQPGTTVTVSWFGNNYDSVTDADGNYSVDVPVSDLSEGASQISVVARNENGVSDVVSIDVDVSGIVDIPVFESLLGTNDLTIMTDGDSLTIGQQGTDLSTTSDASVSSDNVVSVNLSSILDDNGSAAAI